MFVELWLKSSETNEWVSVDLGEDTSISLNKSFEEIEDFTTRTSTYSKTFTIPQSATNDRFFRQAFVVNSSSFAESVVVDAVVKYAGSDVFVGSCRLSSVFNSTQGGAYEIFLTQSLPDFANLAQSIKLIDLDYQPINHTLTYDNISSTWTYTGGSYTNYTGLTGSIVYPLVNYGYESGKYFGKFEDSASGFTNTTTPLIPDQFAPWVSAKYIIDKMFERIDFTYESDFFDSEYFNGIFCLAKTNDTMGARASSGNTENANVFLSTTNTGFFDTNFNNLDTNYDEYFLFDIEQNDPINIFTPSLSVNNRQHYFTAIVAGTYRVKIDYSLFKTQSSKPLYVNVALKDLDDGTIYSQVQGLVLPNEDLRTFTNYFVLNLPANARVGFFYSRNSGGGGYNEATLGVYRATMELLDSPALSNTGEVALQDQLPSELSCLDFFKGIVELFNLVVIPDGKNLKIEKWDDYFSSGVIRDWSQKIDLQSGYSLEPTNSLQKEYIISYKDSDDRFSFKNKQDRNQQFGTYRYISVIPYHQGIKEVVIPFQPLPISTFDAVSESNMLIPHLYFSPEPSPEQKLEISQDPNAAYTLLYQPRGSQIRLGFYNGMLDFTITGTTKTWYMLDGGSSVGHTTYPAISHLSSYEYSASTFSDLNIGNQYDYWQPLDDSYVGFTFNDIWGDFWAPRVQPLYDTDVKIIKCKMKLTPTEIQTLQFNDRVYFLGAYWRLLSMTDADITQTTLVDCEWIKLPYSPTAETLIPPTYQQTDPSVVPTPSASTYSHNVYVGNNTFTLCDETATLQLVYSNCSTLSAGCSVFSDTGATTPIDEGTLIKPIGSSTIYQVIDYGIITNFQNC